MSASDSDSETSVTLEQAIRGVVREAVEEALEGAALPAGPPALELPEEDWRSRIHRVHPDTRLSLSEVAEALDVSERTVRRYVAGKHDAHPELPSQKGPTGLTIRAGDLLAWVEDVEDANRFRKARSA